MSEVETLHDVVEEEIHFKEDVPIVERSTPPPRSRRETWTS